jgi:hypothetical protein
MLPRREADLDAADTFLPLVLGMVSLARRLDAVLEVVPSAPARRGPEPGRSPPADDQATIHLLLGIIALRRGLSSHLHAEAGDSGAAASSDVRAPHAEERSLHSDVPIPIPRRALLR